MWIVPPRSAVWIPGGARHAAKATGVLEGYNAFVDPDVGQGLPVAYCAISVTPLLRELLMRAAHLPLFYEEGRANSRLVAVLLDEFVVRSAWRRLVRLLVSLSSRFYYLWS